MSSFAPQTNVTGTFVRLANDDFHKFTAWERTTTYPSRATETTVTIDADR